MKQLAILLSGSGSTAATVIQACQTGELRDLYQVACIISNKPEAGGLDKARALGVLEDRIHVIEAPPPLRPGPIEDDKSLGERRRFLEAQALFGLRLLDLFMQHEVTTFAQLGWMPKTPETIIDFCPGLNQHPGPLDPGFPDFGGPGMFGRRVHAARLAFVREIKRPDQHFTESTVQLVAPQFDRGALISTRRLEIEPHDTVVTLQQRLLPLEHENVLKGLILVAHNEAEPLQRRERLVLPREVNILKEAKRQAKRDWPEG